MAIFSELRSTLEGLESRMGDVDIDVLLTAMRRLDDDSVVGALAGAAAVAQCAERMLTVSAGVVAERSRREAGHSGMAAKRGHRNATALVQSIVGGTRADAARAVRLGESLVEAADAAGAGGGAGGGAEAGDGWGGGDGWDWGAGGRGSGVGNGGEPHSRGGGGWAGTFGAAGDYGDRTHPTDSGAEGGWPGTDGGATGTDGSTARADGGSMGTDGYSGAPGAGGGLNGDAEAGPGGYAGAGRNYDESATGGHGGPHAGPGDSPRERSARMPWHEPLRQALFAGTITTAQHDAIFRGMGQPPARDGADEPTDEMLEVWSLAAAQLVEESADMSVEDLTRRARQLRDSLDPQGVQERFERSYAARSWRSWRNADGEHHTHIISDDETAAWLDSIRDAALRPRRGGPRFMTDEDRAAASALVDDPRTNDQIAYDLFMDILRAGSQANAADVFGARQPGIRIVTIDGATGVRDAFGRMLATGHLEDHGDALPGSVVDRNRCTVGSRSIVVDGHGNPLDVGREHRLFTAKQRIALAVRDGGCMFPECRVPASYCEAHHCDHWHEDLGLTDINRGILLCRHHHMLLHNNGWKITREGLGRFMLHPPGKRGRGAGDEREQIPLTSRSAIRWAWDPPPEWPRWRSMPADGADARLSRRRTRGSSPSPTLRTSTSTSTSSRAS